MEDSLGRTSVLQRINSLPSPAKASGDNRHGHVVLHVVVHQGAKDNVGIGINIRVDHFRRSVDLRRSQMRSAAEGYAGEGTGYRVQGIHTPRTAPSMTGRGSSG